MKRFGQVFLFVQNDFQNSVAGDSFERFRCFVRRVEEGEPRNGILESIQSGTVYGFVGVIDNIVSKMQSEIGQPAQVIGTGGVLPVIEKQVQSIQTVDPFLTLEGLRILYQRNRST